MGGLCCQFPLQANAQTKLDDLVIATPPFSLADDSLKANTKGVDVDKLIATGLKNKPIKSEYETSADFKERLRKFSESHTSGKIGTGSRVAVIQSITAFPTLFPGGHSAVKAEYNAETETMSIEMDEHMSCLPLRRITKPKGQYTATNGLGIKVNVIEVDETETCIGLTEGGAIKKAKLSFSFNVPKKDAPAAKSFLGAVVIGRLALPYAEEEEGQGQPTTKSPIEINRLKRSLLLEVDDVWIINTATGKVFAKEKSLFANSEPTLKGGFGIGLFGRTACSPPNYKKSELPNFDLVVELEFVVDSDGSVLSGSVKKSSGIGDLDNRALKAISGCKFIPGTKDGNPIRAVANVKFNFDSSNAWNL